MLRSSLCDYNGVYILVKGIVTVSHMTAPATATNITNKKVIFKNWMPFTDCISEINNTQLHNAQDIDDLIEYSDHYSKALTSLWQCYRDEPALNAAGSSIDFSDNNNSISFKFRWKITGQTGNGGTKDVEIIVPLKHLSKFWRTLEMPLIDCEINLILTWSANIFIIVNTIDGQVPTFAISDTKLYVPVVTLLTQDNVKLLDQLKSGFKRTINWKKHQSKATIQPQNQYPDYLTDLSFQGVNTLFVLLFKNNAHQLSYKPYFLPTVETKDCNVMIDGKNVFDQTIKNNTRTYDNIKKTFTQSRGWLHNRLFTSLCLFQKLL